MKSWKLLHSETAFDDFVKLEKRTYELSDGTTKYFYIKAGPSATCVLALTEDQRVITFEQFRPGPNKMLFELPGGYIDDGETPEEAVARELREETGYEGDIEFITNCFDDAYTTMQRGCFVATNCKKVSEQALDEGEFGNVHLLELPDFLKLVRSGQMTDVEVALLGLDHLGLLGKK